MDRLLNAQKGLALAVARTIGTPQFGVVTSYNPNDGTAKVMIQPEGTLTGWLPVLAQGVGSGWGIHVPLKGGEQVMVLPHDGDVDNGVIVGRCYSDTMQPPAPPGSDVYIKSSGGAVFNLLSNGNVVVSDASGSSITFGNNGTITINCQNFVVNATTNATIETPVMDISTEVLIGTGPLKVNNVTVVVP